ncbi:MAG: HisA/HisF-related TIM barrel protein [Actinomycetota bacterium]|nr:HisA/HisF-related TIM barrel protein [Actinomycetota bacterium]
MLRPRVIPILTLDNRSLVKTLRFRDPIYLGDPVNALRIFDTKEVDEIVILDITASKEGREPNIGFVTELAGECFMPVAYGGGISSVETMRRVLEAGVEKIAVNTAALRDPALVGAAAREFGSQAVIASLDVTKSRLGQVRVADTSSRRPKATTDNPVAWATSLVTRGAGELLLTSVDRDGTASGYDLELVSSVASAVHVPVIACGGAGSEQHLRDVLRAGAAGAGAGRMFVTHGKHRAALVSYLPPETIANLV